MRVVIVFPQVGYCTGYRPHLERKPENGGTYHIAQCLPYLYSISRQFTDEVKVVDFNFGTYDTCINAVTDFAPDIMLLSTTVNSYDSTREIVSAVHERVPRAKIYIGGPAVTANYRRRSDLLRVDAPCTFVVTERDIFAWTEQVFGRRSSSTFATFEPSYDWLPDTYGDELSKIRHTVITSLGCTFTCNFCLNHSEYSIEYKQTDVLRRELETLRSLYGVNRVSVSDPYFFMKFRHANEVMSVFNQAELEWSMQTTLVTMTDENIRELHKYNCKSVLVGIENFFSREINKPVDAEKLEHCIDVAREHGIKIKPSFIVGLLDIDVEVDIKQVEYIYGLLEREKVSNTQIQANIYSPYIPDARDRLLDVPFRFWGVMPVSVLDAQDWKNKLHLCDLVYERIYPETTARYQKVKSEYLAHVDPDALPWLPAPAGGMGGGPELLQIKRNEKRREHQV